MSSLRCCCTWTGRRIRSGQPPCCWHSTATTGTHCPCCRSGALIRYRFRLRGRTARNSRFAGAKAFNAFMRSWWPRTRHRPGKSGRATASSPAQGHVQRRTLDRDRRAGLQSHADKLGHRLPDLLTQSRSVLTEVFDVPLIKKEPRAEGRQAGMNSAPDRLYYAVVVILCVRVVCTLAANDVAGVL